MKEYNRIAICGLFLCTAKITLSCDSQLKTALQFAEKNKHELELVLQHYSVHKADSLKYQAARFLIENMPFHYCYAGDGMNDFRLYYSLFCEKGITRQELINRVQNFKGNFRDIYQEFDITKLDHIFLIQHIDDAFITLKYPWNKDLTFSDFCEYILPYRIGNEQVENWMPIYRNCFKETIQELEESNADKYTVAVTLKDSLRKRPYEVIDGITMKLELKPSDYLQAAGGACPEITSMMMYTLRSVGLPVNYDYVIQWANRSQGHNWNSLLIDSVLYPFGMSDNVEFGKHFEVRAHERMGKVYRRTFSFQTQSLFNQPEALDEQIPVALKSPFFKDVSELYFDGIDITMKLTIPIQPKKKFAYLAVFDNRNWVPIAWSKIKNGYVTFKNIEKGCAYMIMYYHENRLHPATDPFTISKEGDVVMRVPNDDCISITLKRKYPIFFDVNFILNRVKNGKFQVADNPAFRRAKTIYITPEVQDIRPYYADVDNVACKYVRYVSPPGAFVSMAEVEFYDPSGKSLSGEIIGTDGSYWDLGNDKYKLFDKDPLTYFDAPEESDGWAGMAFDSVQTLKRIMFLPRNDDNFIQVKELYELYYYSNGEFISLGQRIGDQSHVLRYDNVPGNSILLLRNHSKGSEERIFTWENETQVWW